MLYTTIKIKDKEYKLRLNARATVDLERRLGTNPLNIFIKNGENSMPDIKDLMVAFHASLQEYQHNIQLDDVYGLYDSYCENGGDIVKFVNIIIEVYRNSGLIPKETKDNNAKN